MCKRISSFIIALAMLLSLINFGVGPARAAPEDPQETGGHFGALQVKTAGNWDSFYQNAGGIEKNSSYEASFWLKGSGTVTLEILNDSWSKTVAEKTFTATDTWTRHSLTLNTGDYSFLTYAIRDKGAAGSTILVDDAFMGSIGGDNKLAGGDFENGNTGWAPDFKASVFSISSKDGRQTQALQVKTSSSWETFRQNAGGIEKNTSYEASFWAKGSGKVTLEIRNANWEPLVASKTIIATEKWTRQSLAFSTGDNSYLIYVINDNADSGNTLLIDDAFMGAPGGDNKLAGGDFENGKAGWESPSDPAKADIFTIQTVSTHPVSAGVPQALIDERGFVDELNDASRLSGGYKYGFDTANQSSVGGDNSRLNRGAAASVGDVVYAEYHTQGYDIDSFSIDMYYWTDLPVRDITVSASQDGHAYTPVNLEVFDAGGNWKKVIYSNYNVGSTVSGATYLRISFPEVREGEVKWTPQMSRVVVNLATAPVTATPGSGKLEGPQDIVLSSHSPGAVIHYFTNTDPTDRIYTGPIHLEGRGTITAYAQAPGKLKSYTTLFNYYSDADLKVDKYGQLISANFPRKVTGDQQLKNDVVADESYYNALTPPERDMYGGLPNSKDMLGLEKTGYFHIEKKGGKFYMVNPDGNLYFSSGVDGPGYVGDTFTHVKGREYIYQWLPDVNDNTFKTAFLNGNPDNFSFYVANMIRKFGKPFSRDDYYNLSVSRLKGWGFTSEGGWATRPTDESNITDMFPQVDFIDLPSADQFGSGFLDVYKTGVEEHIDQAIKDARVPENKDNKWQIGYFFGNEIPYHKFKGDLVSSKASSVATKAALIDMLKQKYNDDIAAYNAAWGTDFTGFGDLGDVKLTINTEAAGNDMNGFMAQYLDRYYKMLQTEFRKFDTNHLLLGDRYLTNTMNDQTVRNLLCEAAGKYMDVITYNYYTYDLDMARIQSMAQLANKPLMFTEFHYGEPTEGLSGGIRTLDNETDKGKAYRNYVEKAAASGLVVGAHWFEYLDQAATGRWFSGYNGENFAIGLLDVADHPYKDMLANVMEANYHIYDLILGNKEPYSFDFGPGRSERQSNNKAEISKAESPMVIDGVKDAGWPKGNTIELADKDRVLGAANPSVSASISLAWDADYLYVYAHVKDPTPGQNAYTGFDIWNGDAVEMFVGPDDIDRPGSLKVTDSQIILSGTGEYYWYNNKQTQPAIATAAAQDDDGLGYTIEAAIPLADLNIKDAAAGQKFRFDIGLDNGEGNQRVAQYLWNGGDDNSSARDKWGMATLVNEPPIPDNPGNPGNPDNPQSTDSSGGPAASGGEILNVPGREVQAATPVLNTATGEAAGAVSADALKAIFAASGKAAVRVPEVKGAQGYALRIPAQFLNTKDGSRMLEIKTAKGTVCVSANMLEGVNLNGADSVTLVIAAADAKGIDGKAKALVEGKPVIELSLRVNGKTVGWNSTGAPVTVSIPYGPAGEEAAHTARLTVLHIDGAGQAVPVPSGRYDAAGKSMVFTAAHSGKYAAAYVQVDFNDLGLHEWARQAIEALAAKGIIAGVGEHQYAPAKEITRADFIVLLTRTLGLKAQGTGTFDDVNPDSYYAEAVGTAQTLGFAAGVGNNLFMPNAPISRQDMMTLTVRALKLAGKLDLQADISPLNRFEDRAEVAEYAERSAATLVAAGLIHGWNERLNPQKETTRAETAVFLSQVYHLIYP